MIESYTVKFYIADKNAKYVDFTDHLKRRGKNLLSSISSISSKTESKAVGGVYISSISDVTMSNADGFWDNPTLWEDTMTTEDGSTAAWNYSKNGREVSLQKNKCKIVIETVLKDGTVQEDCIGVFRISDFSTDNVNGTAKIKLSNFSIWLKQLDASKVKDGKTWYQNKNIVFLIKELLKLEFADTSGDLPDSFSFPDVLSMPTFDGSRVFSNFGRPPEYIASSDEWVNLGYTTRSMVWSSGTTLGVGIMLGCDHHLYLYKIEEDAYYLLGSTTSGYNIKRLWINGNTVYGAAWGGSINESHVVSMKLFRYTSSTLSNLETISSVFIGDFCNRAGVYQEDDATGGKYARLVGNVSEITIGVGLQEWTHTGLENILIPFSQLNNSRQDLSGQDFFSPITSLLANDTSVSVATFIDATHTSGYYTCGYKTDGLTNIPKGLRTRFTYSQYGFVEYIPNFATNGAIIYCISDSETYTSGDTYTYKVYVIDDDASIIISGMSTYTITSSGVTVPFSPTCGAVNFDTDSIYIGGMGWSETTKSFSNILKLDNIDSIIGTSDSGNNTQLPLLTGGPFRSWMLGKTAYNTTDNSSAIVTSVGSVVLTMDPGLTGGSDNTWQTADSFRIGDATTITTLYSSSGDTDNIYRTFLDMTFDIPDLELGGYSSLIVTYLNRDSFGTGSFGGIAAHSSVASSNTLTWAHEFSGIPTGLVSKATYTSTGETWYLTTSDGIMYTYVFPDILTVVDGGNPYVETESNIASNLCVIPFAQANTIDTVRNTRTEDIVFGISAPFFPNETQENAISGKFYLWKYDNYLSDRVDLADFTDMNVWDAITQVSQTALGYVLGFDTDDSGSFFLTKVDSSTYTSTDLSSDNIDSNIISISKDRGLGEIYNYCKIAPYYSKMSDIKPELYVGPRETDNEEKIVIKVGDIGVDVRALHAINLKLICNRTGYINKVYTDMDNCPLFRWQTYSSTINARTIGDISGTSLTVASTFRGGADVLNEDGTTNYLSDAINVNDYVTFIDPDDQTEEVRRITAITDTVLTLSTSVTFSVPNGTILDITHSFDVNGTPTIWSSEGVTIVTSGGTATNTIYVASKTDLGVYTVIQLEGDTVFARISTIGDYSESASGYTLTLTGNTVSCSAGKKVYAYYSPCLSSGGSTYDYFNIGGTGVYLQIVPENSLNVNVREGDRITIKSEGLVLEKSEESSQVAQNVTSIAAYGRLEFPSVDNRFFDRNHAKHYCRKLINDYADPHYILDISRPLYPTMRFVDSSGGILHINLFDKKLFPMHYVINAYIREIDHDLNSGTTKLVIRAIDPY